MQEALSDNISAEIHVGPVAGQSRDIVAPALMIVSTPVSALVGKRLAIRTACTANSRQSSAFCDFMTEDQFRGVGHGPANAALPSLHDALDRATPVMEALAVVSCAHRAWSRKESAGDRVW
jgi:hypothetical protein